MNQLASLLSVAIFAVVATIGAQRLMFNEAMANAAERLGISKVAFRVIGAIEVVLAAGLIAGVKGTGGGLKLLSVIAGFGIVGMVGGEIVTNLRKKQPRNYLWPLLVLAGAALIEVLARIVA
jgi:hypothetical protein